MSTLPYRLGVGIMLVNEHNQVFVGKRHDQSTSGPNAWQMPQGGIDEGEEPLEAALRELLEEVGTNKAQLLADYPGWLTYDIPQELISQLWQGRYRGQKQKWFLMRLLGGDELININTAHPEFNAWKWEDINKIEASIVPFKRELYRRLVTEFAPKV